MKNGLHIYIRLWNLLGSTLNYFKIVHFRLLGITIGKNCRIYSGVRISGNVSIGEDGQITIGNDVLIGSLSHIISGHASVEIADHCIFAPSDYISDGTHDIQAPNALTKHTAVLSERVMIGKNVWLGVEVSVLKGVTIGEGAVVGAKSLVNKSIPSDCIAAGIPAAVIRKRK